MTAVSLLSKLLGVTGFRILGAGCTFGFTFLAARLLPLDEAARVLWLIATTSFLGMLARGGLDKGFISSAATATKEVPANTAAIIVIRKHLPYLVVSGASLSLLLLAYGYWGKSALRWREAYEVLLVGAPAVAAVAITMLGSSANIGSGLVARGTLLGSPAPALIAILGVVALWLSGKPLTSLDFCLTYTAGWTLTAILTVHQSSGAKSRTRAASDQNPPPLRAGWFSAIGIANTLEQWAPAIIAGSLMSASTSAGFVLCARLVSVIQLLMVSATAAYANMYATASPERLAEVVRKAVISVSLIGVPAIVLLFVFAELALSIFGAEYLDAARILRIMLIGQLFNVALGAFSVVLMMRGVVAPVAKIFIVSCGFQIAMALVAAHKNSPDLLAISTVVAILVHTASSYVVYRTLKS